VHTAHITVYFDEIYGLVISCKVYTVLLIAKSSPVRGAWIYIIGYRDTGR
jgi:hypothetical protein